MRTQKTVLTTGDVAKICCVAPRTVSKWVDEGHLRGYRIPGSKDRRIPIDQLVRFMRAHGIPLNGLDDGSTRVLVIDPDPTFSESIRTALCERGGYDVTTASTAIEAGAVIQQQKPGVIVLDLTLPDLPPRTLVQFLRTLTSSAPVCLFGTARGLTEAAGQGLLQEGFHGYLSKPFELRSLVRLLEDKLSSPAEETTG